MRRPTITESETHVVLFTAAFLGRRFDSRLHHHHIGLFREEFPQKVQPRRRALSGGKGGSVTRETYVSSAPIFLVAVGNLPIPAPTTSSATVTYTSATVPVMRV